MASIGQELKRERELRGISIKEIADTTKINLKFLKALEEDQLEILPGKFFTKGIIRAYARCLGLDEDSVLNKYLETMLESKQNLEEEHREKKGSPEAKRRMRKIKPLFLIFAALILLTSLIFLVARKKETSLPQKMQPASLSIQEEAEPPLPSNPPQETELVGEEKEILLKLNFKERTWIQVYADGELKLDGIRIAGEEFEIKAQKELLINLGNAGGLTYTLNEKNGKPFGARGAVVKNIKITLENYKDFLEDENKVEENN